ncbi:NAD(P)/FAD-dependent oxidoreductase [Celerinatantimonas yamalensis]|uniref:FAD-binding oxidoreductase n=1 Tax=Celerinatantimonas yamalensis TaxID=559956 RepID=A0ABW9G7M1_9GAMM
MTAKPYPDSYYAASANQAFVFPSLSESIQADVCVIGSGITGVVSALKLAEQGYKVALLEAEQVGFGASGRSGGQAIFGWACEQSYLENLVGQESARHFWSIALEGLAHTKQRIKDYQIDCDWCDGMAHLGMKARHDHALQTWYHQLQDNYGYNSLTLWDNDQVREQIDSPLYTSGLYDANSGHLHPLNYTLGLVAAAKSAGVDIYQGSRVTQIIQGESVTLKTVAGQVQAKHVILACNAYLEGLSPYLESRVMPVGTYIAATEPLGEAKCWSLMKGMAACDINFVLDYYRCSADHRLLFGGRVSYSGAEPRDLKAIMRAQMIHVFPQLRAVNIDYAWGGYVGITMNRAPHFGRLANNIYYAQGFSGHGIAACGIAGELMAEAIATTAERFDLFTRIPHRAFPGGRLLRTPALVLAMAYYRIRDYL